MLRTCVVFAALIVAVVAFLPKGHDSPSNQAVDYAAPLQIVRAHAPFRVLAPRGLPTEWVPTHARIHVPQPGDGSALLDLGFYVPSADAYAALEQSDAPGLVVSQLGPGAPLGALDINGVSWQRYVDRNGRPALARTTTDHSTVVIDGKAPLNTLRMLAASLR